MHALNRRIVVPYSAKHIFELINDIASYPKFIPWCSASKIISMQDHEVVATLEISWRGVRKSFTTRNKLHPDHQVDISLVAGPLSHLTGSWYLRNLTETTCEVNLDLNFAFMGRMIDFVFEPIFKYIANSLVDAFVRRAHEIYGNEHVSD